MSTPDTLDPNFAKRMSDVLIESPSMNSRRITANTIIDGSIEDVWSILTDYDNLASHIPNLVRSNRVATEYPSGITLFQEGAQKIMGFDFSASLTMNMDEVYEAGARSAAGARKIEFKLVDSFMFSSFDGEWTLRVYSRSKVYDPVTKQHVYKYKTQLTYSVYVRPKGPVPVIALEWRIREDIPLNLLAVKMASEKISGVKKLLSSDGLGSGTNGSNGSGGSTSDKDRGSIRGQFGQEWYSDETLGTYIGDKQQIKRVSSGSSGTGSRATTPVRPRRKLQAWGRDAWGRVRGNTGTNSNGTGNDMGLGF